MCRIRGSLTIYGLLSLLLITGALLSLFEGTRFWEMRYFAGLQTEVALESAFSNYNSFLWENYHLLGTEQEQTEALLKEYSQEKEFLATDFLKLESCEVELTGYTRLTDGEGQVFIHSVAEYMEENFVYEAAKEIYSQYESIKNLLEASQMDISNIGAAVDELDNAASSTKERSLTVSRKANIEAASTVRDLLETAKQWQKMGILQLVLKDTKKVSTAEVDLSTGLGCRELLEGKNSVVEETGWSERILLQQYLLTYLSNYQNVRDNRALDYEIEYLLGGKSSDMENLKITATKLLAVREAANFTYLISNPTAVAKVDSLAVILAGATLSPVFLEVIKIGLLTAWALAESILDVRALLAGKKIALMKSEETWTVELENIGSLTEDFAMAKESKWGLSYEGYVGILLLFENEQNLAMETMELQEFAIRKNYQDTTFKIDSLIVQAKANISYSYETVVPFLQVMKLSKRWLQRISTTGEYNYYSRKAGAKG